MHPMILGFAGYSLLLSSCIALILLLRMGCLKDILKNPIHILSTSDTLISMLTSIMLLVNQSIPLANTIPGLPTATTNEITGRQLLQRRRESEDYYQNYTCMRFYGNYTSALINDDTSGSAASCTFKHVLMQYAMFLVPFANAFISLLIYSVQCSRGMNCVTKKCSRLIEPAHTDAGINFGRQNLNAEDGNVICKDTRMEGKSRDTILTLHNETNKNPKFTGFSVITQWLVPVLVTAILYFSKHQDMTKLHKSDDMDCIFKVNFPFGICEKTSPVPIEYSMASKRNYSELAENLEVENYDTSRIASLDAEVVDDIVSRIRGIVQSALNKTCVNSTDLNYVGFDLWNITKYITVDGNLDQPVTNNGHRPLDQLIDIQELLRNEYPEIVTTCNSTSGEDWLSIDPEMLGDTELKLFEDLVNNAEINTTIGSTPLTQNNDFVDLAPAEEETAAIRIITNQDTTHIANMNVESNETETRLVDTSNENNEAAVNKFGYVRREPSNQIYEYILKRIQDTVNSVEVKEQIGNMHDNYTTNNSKFDGKLTSSKADISWPRSGVRKIQENRKNRENSLVRNESSRSTQPPLHLNQSCFLSTKFLKTHLLILLFLIYFLPLTISVVLQTRAIYTCKNLFEKIETATKSNSNTSLNSPVRLSDQSTLTVTQNLPSNSGWFSELGHANLQVSNTLKSPKDSTPPNFSASPDNRGGIDMGSSADTSFKKESSYKIVLFQAQSVQMLFNILTKSLLLGVLMWTPAFLEILSKVFLCTSPPAWLVDGLYLLGISFGTVKNFFNVSLAKINKNISEPTDGKENSIHPSV